MHSAAVQKRPWILAALMMTMMLAAMDTTIVSTAIPQIVSDLGGFNKFSWVFSVYLLAQTITIPLYGKFADLFGRKRILVFGILVFLIGSASCALSWNITTLIIFRGIQGLGAGSILATVNTIAGDIYKIEERAKVQGLLSSIWGISAIVGPTLGGTLAEYVSWHWIFLINLPIGILALLLITSFFKEKLIVQKHKIDYKGASLMLLSLSVFFVFLLEGGQSWQWSSFISIALLLTSLACGIAAIKVELKHPEAMLPAWLWKNPTLAFTNLAMVFMGMVMMGPETYLPTFAQTTLGLGTIASGFILASVSLGWPTASALSGKLYMRFGFRNTSLLGASIVIIACLFFLAIPYPQPVIWLIIGQVLLGAGFGMLSTPSLVGIQALVGWQQRGVVTGANIFSRNLGQSLGAAVVGAIFNGSLKNSLKDSKILKDQDQILTLLHHNSLSNSQHKWLQESINIAMRQVYIALTIFALVIVIWLYFVPNNKPQQQPNH